MQMKHKFTASASHANKKNKPLLSGFLHIGEITFQIVLVIASALVQVQIPNMKSPILRLIYNSSGILSLK